MSKKAKYTICGFEIGAKNKTPHIQGYAYFTSAKSLMRMKKFLPRAKLLIANGSPEQNKIYCSKGEGTKEKPKNGDVWEYGEIPTQGLITRDKLDDIMKNPYDNFHLYNQYRRSYKELKSTEPKTHTRHLRLLSTKERFDFANKCDHPVCFLEKLDHYNDETVVFIDYNEATNDYVIRWLNGYPPTIKRGYEIVKFDPELVVLLYDTPHQHGILTKNYEKYLD